MGGYENARNTLSFVCQRIKSLDGLQPWHKAVLDECVVSVSAIMAYFKLLIDDEALRGKTDTVSQLFVIRKELDAIIEKLKQESANDASHGRT